MAIRFPGTAFCQGEYDETFGLGSGYFSNQQNVSGEADVAHPETGSRLFVSPSRYSAVRKVIVWSCWRHEHSGTAATFECEQVTNFSQDVNGDTSSVTVAPGTSGIVSGAGTELDNTFRTGQYYQSAVGNRNKFTPGKIGAVATNGHSGLYYQEFERFSNDPAAVAFFIRWDAVADLAAEDEYIALWTGIKRDDSGSWGGGTGTSNNQPKLATCGVTILQTGSPDNRTCTTWSCKRPHVTFGAMSTTYRTNVFQSGSFNYRATEWDNITGIYVVFRVGGGASDGDIDYRLETYDDTGPGPGSVVGLEASISDNVGSDDILLRTRNLLSDIQGNGDGEYVVGFKNGTSTGNLPMAHWEVIQDGATRKVTPIAGGYTQQIEAGDLNSPPEFNRGSALFDPLWFEDLPDENIIGRNFKSDFLHNSAANNSEQDVMINADLTTTPVGSAFNVTVDSLSDTPNATLSYKLAYRSIATGNDPLNFAGKRQVFNQFRNGWQAGGGDRPGSSALAYIFDMPSTEEAGIGPIFQLDEFNPEGCASTAAGLGDNPGVLAIANGSAPPQKFDPVEEAISNLGIQLPYRDEQPSSGIVSAAASPTGGVGLGVYIYRYTFRNSCTGRESDPSPTDLIIDTSGETPAAQVTLGFGGITIPADDQIDQICVYRTIAGGVFPVLAKVGTLTIGENNNQFVDLVSDSSLDFTSDPLSLLNGFPPCSPIVAEFRNRLFLLGDIPSLSPGGTATVVAGSDEVNFSTGAAAPIGRCAVGKFILFEGDCTRYEILEELAPSVVSPEQPKVKLDRVYEGSSRSAINYILCGRPNRLYYSEPLEPEYWPAVNFIDIEPGDGDRIIGAISNFDALIICKRRKTYTMRFGTTPADISIPNRVSSDIGCVGPRTFAQIENGSVWLADRGIAIYDGRGVRHIPESDKVNDLFVNPDNPRYVRRDRNGRVGGAIGVFYPKRQQYLLLLPTVQTARGANLMLVWDVTLGNITFYEFCQEFTSMEVAKDDDGNERVYLGDANGFVWIFDIGDTDGVGFPNGTGTVRGTISAVGTDSNGVSFLTDSAASFLRGGLPGLGELSGVAGLSGFTGNEGMGIAGVCLFTRAAGATPDTPWAQRLVFASTSTTVYVTPSWGDDLPAVGYEYMLGAIEMVAEFKPRNYDTDDLQKRDWTQIITHEPETTASELRVELIPDFQNSDPGEGNVIGEDGTTGQGRIYKMDNPIGRHVAPVGRIIHNFQQVRFKNFAPEEPVRILNHILRTTPKTSR